VQRERLLAEMLPPIPVRQSSPAIEPAVTMVSVKVEDWDGGPAAKVTVPMMMRRPRRIVGHVPWQGRLIVAGICLTRLVRKSAKQQMRQFNKLQRQMMRRVLPVKNPMRGARARHLACVMPKNQVTTVTSYHPCRQYLPVVDGVCRVTRLPPWLPLPRLPLLKEIK